MTVKKTPAAKRGPKSKVNIEQPTGKLPAADPPGYSALDGTPAIDAGSGDAAGRDYMPFTTSDTFDADNGDSVEIIQQYEPEPSEYGGIYNRRVSTKYKIMRPADGLNTFTGYELPEMNLPLLRLQNGENDAGILADVCHASGYFGDLTPAQIAIHILAGRSLGLDDMQGVFDLEIGPGPTIRYKPARTFQAAGDAIEATKAFDRKSVHFDAGAAMKQKPEGGDDRPTPETESPAADVGSGVVLTDPRFETMRIVETPDGTRFDVSGIASEIADLAETSKSADRGPLPNPTDERPLDSGPDPESPGAAERDGQTERLADALTDMAIRNDASGLIEPAETIATPEPAASARESIEKAKAAESVGDASADTVAAWREAIDKMSGELGIDRKEKLDTFDAHGLTDKRKMFLNCQAYYSTKTAELRELVLAALREDGKSTVEQMQGFFVYAEVGADPIAWTYTEAALAHRELNNFLGTSPAAA